MKYRIIKQGKRFHIQFQIIQGQTNTKLHKVVFREDWITLLVTNDDSQSSLEQVRKVIQTRQVLESAIVNVIEEYDHKDF